MISAAVESTAETTPGLPYILTVINNSVSSVAPRFTFGTSSFSDLPAAVNSATALSIPAGETWTHRFYAPSGGFDLNTTDTLVLWSLHHAP